MATAATGTPTHTERATPPETMLCDGLGAKVTCDLNPDLSIDEANVKIPGFDMGKFINTTSHFNTGVRTYCPPTLHDNTDMVVTGGWAPHLFTDVASLRGINAVWSVQLPDATTQIAFYGALRLIDFGELVEGGPRPEVTLTITATNEDAAGTEQDLAVISAPGT